MADERSDAGIGVSELCYVLAGNYEQARNFARRKGLPYTRLVYVDGSTKIMGVSRKKTLFITGTAHERPDFFNLLELATHRGLKIEYV